MGSVNMSKKLSVMLQTLGTAVNEALKDSPEFHFVLIIAEGKDNKKENTFDITVAVGHDFATPEEALECVKAAAEMGNAMMGVDHSPTEVN